MWKKLLKITAILFITGAAFFIGMGVGADKEGDRIMRNMIDICDSEGVVLTYTPSHGGAPTYYDCVVRGRV